VFKKFNIEEMRKLAVFYVILTLLLFTLNTFGQYQGILINGALGGTQVYDLLNAPHAQGKLHLGLQNYSMGGAAVIKGQLAYFAPGAEGFVCIFVTN
jgi:hypothetical protein